MWLLLSLALSACGGGGKSGTVDTSNNDLKLFFQASKDLVPFPPDDTDVFLDIDFTKGEASVDTILVKTNGFSKNGTGGIWDSTLGWNPNGSQWYGHNDFIPAGMLDRSIIGDRFTIYTEVRREDISSTWRDDQNFFIDSAKGPSAGADVPANHPYGNYITPRFGSVISLLGTATPPAFLKVFYQVTSSGSGPVGRFVLSHRDISNQGGITLRIHPDVPDITGIDPDFARFFISIDGRQISWYIDGRLVKRYNRATDIITDDIFHSIGIGGTNSTDIFRGYIRRIQFSRRPAFNDRILNLRIAFLGDSFVQRGGGVATPASLNITSVNQVQNMLDDNGLYSGNDPTMNPVIGTYWLPWIHGLQLAASNQALRFRAYVAGDAGHGWASDVNQFRPCFLDAVVAYNPELLIALGSVNDVNPTSPPRDLIGDTKQMLDRIIDGTPALKRILFFETFPGHKGISNISSPSWADEYRRQIALQSDLDGYRGIVDFIPVYNKLGGDAYDPSFNVGSHPLAPAWDALYSRSITGRDVHPGQHGMNSMVEKIWPHVKKHIFLLTQAGPRTIQ